MVVENRIITDSSFENRYIQTQSNEHRKKYAQFFTSPKIAAFMVSWLLQNSPKRILEPAFGLGIFSRFILNACNPKHIHISGIELDHHIYEVAKGIFKPHANIEISKGDFIFYDWSNEYDGIICNPPYLKFHDYDNKRVIGEVENRTGYSFKYTSNLYVMFLIKSIVHLAEGGRASFIVPTEFLNSDYGVAIKKFLLDTNVLRYIFVIDSNYLAFEKVLTTSTILLLQKDRTSDLVGIQSIENVDCLSSLTDIIGREKQVDGLKYFNNSELDPNKKWSEYYRYDAPENKIKKVVPFSFYAQVSRGIATGHNDYFTFNKQKAEEHDISAKTLLPCITKAAHVRSSVFTLEDLAKLREENKTVYLFDGERYADTNTEKYLDYGVLMDVDKRYLTSKRNPWYRLENKLPADLWIGVFNRKTPRFILNQAGVLNLTCFHGVHLRNASKEDKLLMVAYLISDASIYMLDSYRREYGNGLKKFEPNDINHSMMMDIYSLPEEIKKRLIKLGDVFLEANKEGDKSQDILEAITDIFFNYFR